VGESRLSGWDRSALSSCNRGSFLIGSKFFGIFPSPAPLLRGGFWVKITSRFGTDCDAGYRNGPGETAGTEKGVIELFLCFTDAIPIRFLSPCSPYFTPKVSRLGREIGFPYGFHTNSGMLIWMEVMKVERP
jgi:hypothetical protein